MTCTNLDFSLSSPLQVVASKFLQNFSSGVTHVDLERCRDEQQIKDEASNTQRDQMMKLGCIAVISILIPMTFRLM